MPTNAEKFLDIFNLIEKHLKSTYNNGYYMPFGELARKASGREGLIKKYRDELFTYSDLRNVMVHNSRISGKMIAEPHDHILEKIQYIWEQIEHPQKVSQFKKILLSL